MSFFIQDKAFYKKLLAIALPISLQQVITAGVNMMDTVMLGKLGDVALSASSSGAQIHTFFMFLMMGISAGSSVMISRYWGAGDKLALKKTIAMSFRCVIVMSLVYTLIVASAPLKVIALLTDDAEVITEGAKYLVWAIPCFFLHGMTIVASFCLRNFKKASIPLYSSIAAFFINIFANWVFIFGKLGAPAMGVAGAALGTTISRAFEFLVIVGYFFFKNEVFRFSIKEIFTVKVKDITKEFLRIVAPVMISDTVLGVGNTMTVAIAGRVGRAYMTANSITNVVRQGTRIFTTGLGQASSIVIGNTLGEGRSEDAQKQGITMYALSVLLGVLCCVLILIFGPLIVASYDVTSESAAAALELMKSIAIVMIFLSPSTIMTKGVLRGGGDTRYLMVADVVFLWVLSIPLGYSAGLIWKLSPFIIFMCLRADEFFKAVITLFRLRSGKWMKKIETRKSEL